MLKDKKDLHALGNSISATVFVFMATMSAFIMAPCVLSGAVSGDAQNAPPRADDQGGSIYESPGGFFIGGGMVRRGLSDEWLNGESGLINMSSGAIALLPTVDAGFGWDFFLGGKAHFSESGRGKFWVLAMWFEVGSATHRGEWGGASMDSETFEAEFALALIYAKHPLQPFISLSTNAISLCVEKGMFRWTAIEDYDIYSSGYGIGLGINYLLTKRLSMNASMNWRFFNENTLESDSLEETGIGDIVFKRSNEIRFGLQHVFWSPRWLR